MCLSIYQQGQFDHHTPLCGHKSTTICSMVYNGLSGMVIVMAKVYDVPPHMLIERVAVMLREEGIEKPVWTAFVKTGSHADRPPHRRDWWYVRCASILRKIYIRGPIGVKELRGIYGGGRASGYGAAHHRNAGGAIIRNALHGLETLGMIENVEKKGRKITSIGMKKLDNISTQILKDMVNDNPTLKAYL